MDLVVLNLNRISWERQFSLHNNHVHFSSRERDVRHRITCFPLADLWAVTFTLWGYWQGDYSVHEQTAANLEFILAIPIQCRA